jgi:hypothetical protein
MCAVSILYGTYFAPYKSPSSSPSSYTGFISTKLSNFKSPDVPNTLEKCYK